MPKLTPPEDRTITTLYIGGIPEGMTEKDLRDHFYQFGELRSVNLHAKQRCAFIQFTTRSAAERAAERTYDRLILGGHRLTVNWGKSPAALAAANSHLSAETGDISLPPVPGLPLPPALPPTNLLNRAMSVGLSGGFFMAPPPPPPPPPPPFTRSLLNSTSDLASGDKMPIVSTIQIAPPVVEPLPPGEIFMRGPPPPPLPRYVVRPTAGLLQTPPSSVLPDPSSTGVLPPGPPPPPPPPPPSSKTVSSKESKSSKDTPADEALGIHYPSQNPQRMGSVPHTEQHD
nr:unnamed protein product [Trichobilharzia regenti]